MNAAEDRPNHVSIWSDAVVEQHHNEWYITVQHEDTPSARQIDLAARVIFDYDAEGQLIGVELITEDDPHDRFQTLERNRQAVLRELEKGYPGGPLREGAAGA